MPLLQVLSDVLQRHGQLTDKVLPLIVSAIALREAETAAAPLRAPSNALLPIAATSSSSSSSRALAPLRKMALVCLSRLLTEEFVRFKGEAVHG